MSSVYSLEPATNGKVVLETTFGDIEIEVWGKEVPKASRNFMQLCMEGYYDGLEFHRVVPNYLVQTGDPTGTGYGGDSVYGGSFAHEFHSRIRFSRRGMVAFTEDNKSQFFITLDTCQELAKKYTLFGKVTGNGIYTALHIGEAQLDEEGRPVTPILVKSVKIIANPFPEIRPRFEHTEVEEEEAVPAKKQHRLAKRNVHVLSFQDELDEENLNSLRSSKRERSIPTSKDVVMSGPVLSTPVVFQGDNREEVSTQGETPATSKDVVPITTLVASAAPSAPSTTAPERYLASIKQKYAMGSYEERKKMLQEKTKAALSQFKRRLEEVQANGNAST